MNEKENFLLAQKGHKYFIKIMGSPRYNNSENFWSYINNRILQDEKCEDILVDLRETQYMDSTNLGLLARLAGFLYKKLNRKMTAISTNPDINDLLINTGFDQILLLVENANDFEEKLSRIPDMNDQQKNMARMMYEAHLELSQMNEKNQSEFKNVVEMLKAEAENMKNV